MPTQVVAVGRGIDRVSLGNLALSLFYLLIIASPISFFIYLKTTGLYVPCYPTSILECGASELQSHRVFSTFYWLALLSSAAVAGTAGTIVSFFLRLTRLDPISPDYVVTHHVASSSARARS